MAYTVKTETKLVPAHPDDGPTIMVLSDGSMTFKWGDDLMFTMQKADVRVLYDYMRTRVGMPIIANWAPLTDKHKHGTCYATEA